MTKQFTVFRACRSNAEFFFEKRILGKYDVDYFKCESCRHVQTEEPHWLEEAYRDRDSKLDVGMVDRCIWTAQTMVAFAWRLKIARDAPCLDWGAGTGLFVRLCRDYGMNFFYFDRYPRNMFARGFEAEPSDKKDWRCISAFEVAEHLPNPREDFGELLRLSPRYMLFTTLLYKGEQPDWWYFTDNGQHVAFYTRRSLEEIGNHYGYRFATNGRDLHLFSKETVRDRVLEACRKKRDTLSRRYRKKYGSRMDTDFADVLSGRI